ncbi:MAG: FAD-dependent oxidoreductase [Planctomycetota bacterium]
MRKDPGKVLIIGGGPTGLGAACRLEELGFSDFLVLEADERTGGLSKSYLDSKGFTWDLGGHVQFSHYRYYDGVLDEALKDRWLWHERESWVWLKNRFIPYPLQNNIHYLDDGDLRRALAGLEQAASRRACEPPPGNFRDWVIRTFGQGLAQLFLLPYNYKVWGYPLETLSWHWIGDRVSVPDIERIRETIRTRRDDVCWGPNSRFRFPEKGGTGAIWEAVTRRINPARLSLGSVIVGVDLDRRCIRLSDGRAFGYDTLLTTMPLDRFVLIADRLPAALKTKARELTHGSVHLLGFGLRGGRPDTLAKKCWMYFPEENSPYYRVTVFSNYSPNNTPEGHWSLMAEVSETRHRKVHPGRIAGECLGSLRRDGLLERDADTTSVWTMRLEHAYPTPTIGRDDALEALQGELERRRVFSRGRFGGWKYEVGNQDHCFMQGVEWANRVIAGEPEVTYASPETISRSGSPR